MTDSEAPSSSSTLLRLRAEGLTWRQTGAEVVALDIDDAAYFGINPAGAELWAALAVGSTSEQLVALLERRYQLSADAARADVTRFLAELRIAGLLTETSPA